MKDWKLSVILKVVSQSVLDEVGQGHNLRTGGTQRRPVFGQEGRRPWPSERRSRCLLHRPASLPRGGLVQRGIRAAASRGVPGPQGRTRGGLAADSRRVACGDRRIVCSMSCPASLEGGRAGSSPGAHALVPGLQRRNVSLGKGTGSLWIL